MTRTTLLDLPDSLSMVALFSFALGAGGSDSTEPLAVAPAGPGGAAELTLAPDLSFTDDSSGNFPIRGRNLSEGRIATDRPTIVFYGTSHCWNTNREAERFVA